MKPKYEKATKTGYETREGKGKKQGKGGGKNAKRKKK